MPERKPLTVRLGDDERDFVEAKAAEEGRSVADWIRRLIRAAMKVEARPPPPPRKPRAR